eukprot:1893717-Pyramimonas_sp.AAC.1
MLKEGNASARDRRTALDLAVVCETLENARGHVRWVPHSRMPVDELTKDDITKGNAVLASPLIHGKLVVVDEAEEPDRRKKDPGNKD